jgi:hypothetical protein
MSSNTKCAAGHEEQSDDDSSEPIQLDGENTPDGSYKHADDCRFRLKTARGGKEGRRGGGAEGRRGGGGEGRRGGGEEGRRKWKSRARSEATP